MRHLVQSSLVRDALLTPRIRETWRDYRVYLAALIIFAASRVVVIIGVNLGAMLTRAPTTGAWDAGPAWYHRLLRWDSGWYAAIARYGYSYSDDPTVQVPTVFYPLYPLLSHAVKSLLGVNEYDAILIVANVASLGTLFLMTKFFRDELGEGTALLSLTFFLFFPSAFFLSAGYTKSLFLIFVLLSLMLLTCEKFGLAAIMAGFSVGTRAAGIVLIPVILWEMWRRNADILSRPRLLARMAVCAVLGASGLLAYMAYLGIEFDAPLAFLSGQTAWGHAGTFLSRLKLVQIRNPFDPFHSHFNWFLFFLALTIWSFWRLRPAVSLYSLGTLMLPYLQSVLPTELTATF